LNDLICDKTIGLALCVVNAILSNKTTAKALDKTPKYVDFMENYGFLLFCRRAGHPIRV
jgi:hypothetical protein